MNENDPIPMGSAIPATDFPAAAVIQRLPHYLNARVTVYYTQQGGFSDTGLLSYLDDFWIELVKDNGERLLTPTSAIRIIKLVEVPKREGDAGILLRPAEGQPPNETRQIRR